ncbi:unnamed protein product [Cyclocybe aegerita]|uniref:MYND-type domain-containing protein n=1 Tax=Cyclocybe aegerita TaxID=1973307 RepID=A0A8S0W395_CYCAE|nr:unnamed protein product [Cyclocybe aegerita]
MPRPGAKKKAKKAKGPSSSSTARPRSDVDVVRTPDIDNSEGWNAVVNVLCDFFQLPDLTTRSGLKKVHASFNAIYTRLDKGYEQNIGNDRIRGGIVGIFARMCVDSLLRNKLFDKGILNKIIPLLHIDETRHLALRSLSTITHHGGSTARIEIARHANVLTKLIRDLPDDEKVAELGVSTLAHSVSAVVEGVSKPANPRVLQAVDMVDVLKTIIEAVKRLYRNPRSIYEHAIELVAMSSMHASSALKVYPSAINFLVAGFRSKDWVTRCTCMGGLIRLFRLEAENDQRFLDPMRFMNAIQRGVPDHLSDILIDYGHSRSEIFLTLSCTNEFQSAMMACMQTHDLYALGLRQAPLILKTEFSVADGMFEVEDPRMGKRSIDDFGLPFKMWSDSLPHAARAIRQKKKPEEQDYADILDIKYMIMRQRIPDAVALAKKGLLRNPEQAYFHYAITLAADNVQGLRAAKKGLKCKQITPFVKYQMMQRAVEHAGDMGVKVLQEMPEAGEQKWEEGIAFLMSALEDAKAYVDGAPPDNRHMKNVGYWFILLTLLVKEDLSPDLRELKDALQKLKIADQFSEFMGVPPSKTNLRLAQQAAIKHYPLGVKEFSRIYEGLDKIKAKDAPEISNEKLEDDLAAWLEDMRLEDGTLEERTRCGGFGHGETKVNFDKVTMYRCSWCGNPSAVLRKCSGCAKTRYCDSGCQKMHWPDHKKACKS